jgi:SAM-dependent methyltransferase
MLIQRNLFDNTSLPTETHRRLEVLLSQDLGFHDEQSRYASHSFHSFPAKFPPQLPQKFINALTKEGDVVLDPMMGSGTTVLEAYLLNRRAVGFDIDPLAFLLTQVKVCPLDITEARRTGHFIVENAKADLAQDRAGLMNRLEQRWDHKTKEFIDYWFALETQLELLALVEAIVQVSDFRLRSFFELALSAIIITKSGGISLALDLAHTRPHKAKIVFDGSGRVLVGAENAKNPTGRTAFLTKKLRSPIEEFKKRYLQNISGLSFLRDARFQPRLQFGNARALDLEDSSVDLIVTSPPYASNAIDYMRAHKFSLVWLGHSISALSSTRKRYIGGESTTDVEFVELPAHATQIVDEVGGRDARKGQVLHRYYSEMTGALQEMYRVLRPGKAAIVVVGSSEMRGIDTQTGMCLADIGRSIGFDVPGIGVRQLDRNRRMMPAGEKRNRTSQIQKRMHEEFVIGFLKRDN